MESELEKNIGDNKQESRCENSNSQKPLSSEYFQELEKEGRFPELAWLYKEKGDYDSAISCLEKARRAYSLENIAESTLNSKTLISSMAHDAWSATKAMGRGTKTAIKYMPMLMTKTVKSIGYSLITPTVCRKTSENVVDEPTEVFAGFLGCLCIDIFYLPSLTMAIAENPKLVPYFFIPLATNFASGIYEWICYKKKKLKEQQQRAQEELRIIAPEKYPYKKEE